VRKRGAWIDLGGIRFVGAGYLGAATPYKVRQIVEKLDPARVHVMLLHAGPDYFVGEGGGFSREDLHGIHERVAYLALGHIHKPMLHGDWACNPGSPENCDLREALNAIDREGQPKKRGYAVVQLDPSPGTRAPQSIEIRSNKRRPCFHLDLDCTPFGSKLKQGALAFENALLEVIAKAGIAAESVVEVHLKGVLKLNRIAVDLEELSRGVGLKASLCALSLDASGLNLANVVPTGEEESRVVTRVELEKQALRELVAEEELFGLNEDSETWVALLFGIKEGVRTGRSVEELAEMIRTSNLVEKVRQFQIDEANKQNAVISAPGIEGGSPS
jgi:DNA repair exonuclease SbcCD nuclease subunit